MFSAYFGEESPPLPVSECKIYSTVSLNDFHGCELFLSYAECPVNVEREDNMEL